jgi:hypothetical protein
MFLGGAVAAGFLLPPTKSAFASLTVPHSHVSAGMAQRTLGFVDVDERLAALSARGDDLERVEEVVDFEMFRPALETSVPRKDQTRGGRPPFDRVLKFKVLILQPMHSLSDERAEFLIKDRLSCLRFLRLGLCDTVTDANAIWTFREALKKAVPSMIC